MTDNGNNKVEIVNCAVVKLTVRLIVPKENRGLRIDPASIGFLRDELFKRGFALLSWKLRENPDPAYDLNVDCIMFNGAAFTVQKAGRLVREVANETLHWIEQKRMPSLPAAQDKEWRNQALRARSSR